MLDAHRIQALAEKAKRRSVERAEERSPDSSSSSSSPLLSLCHELLLRCLGFLDVPSLCVVACAGRLLRVESEDWALWSELFCDRWPVHRDREDGAERWKTDYRDREEQERTAFFAPLLHAVQADDGQQQQQQQLAQWRGLYAAQLRRQRSARRPVNEWVAIRTWREAHALDGCAASSAHGRVCSFVRCALTELLPDLFICRDSHAVHFCSPHCGDDADHDGRCAVSGRWPTSRASALHAIHGDDEDEDVRDEAGELQGQGRAILADVEGGAEGSFLLSCLELGWASVGRADGDLDWALPEDGCREQDASDDDRDARIMDEAFSAAAGAWSRKRRRMGATGGADTRHQHR